MTPEFLEEVVAEILLDTEKVQLALGGIYNLETLLLARLIWQTSKP
jgi:hypothetical protein